MQVITDDEASGIAQGLPGSRQAWLNVWRTLWARSEESRPVLARPIRERAEALAGQPTFEKLCVGLIKDAELGTWARAKLTSWLDAAPPASNCWAKVCAALVGRYGEHDPALVERALEWLQHDGLKLHAWKGLWLQLYAFAGSSGPRQPVSGQGAPAQPRAGDRGSFGLMPS